MRKIIHYSLSALCVGLVFLALYWILSFRGHIRAHEERIAAARAAFERYSQEDWRQLYEACRELHRNFFPKHTGVPEEYRGPLISDLQPYNVALSEGDLWMNWTGGHDEFALYLFAVFSPKDSSYENGKRKGIWVLDTRDDPHKTQRYEWPD